MEKEKEKLLEAVNCMISIVDQLPIQKSSPENDAFIKEVDFVRKKLENVKSNLTGAEINFFSLESAKLQIVTLAGALHRAIRSCESLELMSFMSLISEATIEI